MDLLTQPISSVGIDSFTVLVRLGLTLILAIIASIVYLAVGAPRQNSGRLIVSGIVVAMLVATILMALNNSLLQALGLFAALSIIRFRMPIKDIREMVFIFFAITLGIAVGCGASEIAIYATLFVCISQYLIYYFGFFTPLDNSYLLRVVVNSEAVDESQLDSILKSESKRYKLLEAAQVTDDVLEMTYDYQLGNSDKLLQTLQKIRGQKGVSSASFFSAYKDMDL